MEASKQKVINRNNRMRGAKFEKTVGDYLDMDIVPYSGSNTRFGLGDVRDSVWLGECKNIRSDDAKRRKGNYPTGTVIIKRKWLKDIEVKAKDVGKLPFLAWMPSGRPEKYIMVNQSTFDRLGISVYNELILPKASKMAINFIIDIDHQALKDMKNRARSNGILKVYLDGDNDRYYMMSLEMFKLVINGKGLKGTRAQI